MSEKAFWMALSAITTALIVLSLFVLYALITTDRKIVEAEEARYHSYLLADELRQSSDDLTRMARTYAVTSDSRYADYFQEILDIRNGEAPRPEKYHGIYWDYLAATGERPRPSGDAVALKTLMRESGVTDAEFELLAEAELNSNDLVNLENEAMNAMEGLFKDASGAYTVQGAPDPELARDLLHGSEYHMAKERIMRPLESFFDSIDDRTAAEIVEYRQREETLIYLLMATIGIAAVVGVVSIVAAARSGRG